MFQGAKVFRRIFEPNIPANATQEQIEQSIYTEDFKFMRYEIVEENDSEPSNIKVIILKSSEGKYFCLIFIYNFFWGCSKLIIYFITCF